MAFPTSPSNNDVHKEGNRAFVYDSTLGVWDQVKETDRFFGETGGGVLGTVTAGNIDAVSDIVKLYSNELSSAIVSVEINGYFDDTKYAYYKLLALGIRGTDSGAGQLKFRVMTGGSVDSTSTLYWSAGGGWYNHQGTMGVQERADNDGNNFANMDCTWSIPYPNSNSTENYEITFSEPQNITYYKSFSISSWSGGHGGGDEYTRQENLGISFKSITPLTGINIFANSSTMSKGHFILYGYKK